MNRFAPTSNCFLSDEACEKKDASQHNINRIEDDEFEVLGKGHERITRK